MSDLLRVTCRLAAPLAGEPPRLDALLEYVLSKHHPKGVPGWEIDRARPAPPPGEVPIPLLHRDAGGLRVACCSDPVLPAPDAEAVEHVARRIGVERAGLLDPAGRKVVSTVNTWTKAYRLPLRVRRVWCVRWFARGNLREVREVLQRVPAVGKKVAGGYGRVAGWEVEEAPEDWSWYAPCPGVPGAVLLMRTLPDGPHLPAGLVGFRRDFGACQPPYWHPDRYTEIVVPC